MIKAVVFDFDGTLVDSVEIKRHGFFFIGNKLSLSAKDVEEILSEYKGAPRWELIGHFVDRSIIGSSQSSKTDLHAELVDLYTKRCEEQISVCPEIKGAEKCLTYLKKSNLKVFVNSATPQDTLLDIIRNRGWKKYFDGIYGRPKSKPENIRAISGAYGVTIANCMIVGDGEDDRQCAEEFGITFFPILKSKTNLYDLMRYLEASKESEHV